MPELPEVETIRRSLEPALLGRRVVGMQVHRPTYLNPPAEVFAPLLIGRQIAALERRGKYLLIRLDSGDYWILHLRMTGALRLAPATEGPPRFASITWVLDDGQALHLTDVRRFATVWWTDDPTTVVGKLGPEPLAEGFDLAAFAAQLARRRAPIKAVLLDQTVVAGLGNIYADEALFEAKLHPAQPAHTLPAAAVARLYRAIVAVLSRGLINRGTSLRTYRDGQGQTGRNQESLRVFRRTGRPCPQCGTLIQRLVIGGRSTHLCPACQAAPVNQTGR
jgi:formamidopyrimidine-DNA glycosylase